MFNRLATNGNKPPSRYWRTLGRHQTPKVSNSQRRLGLPISLTPRSLPCLSLHMFPTLKSLRRMSLHMNLTKGYSRGDRIVEKESRASILREPGDCAL